MAPVQLSFVLVLGLVAATCASPAKEDFWKRNMGSSVEEMRSNCANDDSIACLKYKVASFIDNFMNKESYQVSETVEIVRNNYRSNEVGRSAGSVEDKITEYIQSHDVNFKLFGDSTLTVESRSLDDNEMNLKLRFNGRSDNEVEGKGRKSKLKKIIVPIMVFVLLKAMTLIPLALGILGLKAWNALQLSFFSFVTSIAMAIFQLCKKIAADSAHPQIAAHGPWDAAYAARSFQPIPVSAAQQMAYAARR